MSNLDAYRMVPDGFGPSRLAESTSAESLPAFSPEGAQIALISDRADRDGFSDPGCYRMSAAGNRGRRPQGPAANALFDLVLSAGD